MINATNKILSGIMTLVFGNMTLNVKIFSNPRLEDFEENEEINCINVVTQQSLNLLCQKDFVESVLISSIIDYKCYTPRKKK